MTAKVSHHIGGAPVSDGRWHADRDPYTGDVIAEVASGDADNARAAIEAAHAAFPGWAELPPGERQNVFLRAADALENRQDEVLDLLRAETGCGPYFGRVQLDFCLSLLRQAAGLAHAPTGQLLPSDVPGTRALAVRRPVGVVAAIAPWNAALSLAGRAVVGPLALGNTVVLKPSEESPITGGVLWAELFAEAGLPPGAVNVVTHAPGDAGAIAEELVTHPLVRRISFTGSTVTGRRLAELAARHLKRPILQLSGHNALIVRADADLDLAVKAATYGAFVHQGEICMCVRRILVEAPVAEEFTTRFVANVAALPVGDPGDPRTVVGPLINEWALSLVARRVDEAVAMGARLLTGGVAEPPCYRPTVLTGVPADAEIAFEETFGPVALLETVAGGDEAVERANASRFGLTAGIISADTYGSLDLARRLDVGIVHLNDQTVNDEPQMPFGGVKDSGWGRFGLQFASEDFTDLQWITMRDKSRGYPF
ncbi:aldehyde dehydrogenase family protein [Actinoplanes sp. Pm04-4]|uniref:Aldehyde dehydrogenase family protein n=1 Tax=Paractinoplanes pyxinae TaxID=2997416 RepID=A0ABT4B3B1_9ACTN|nr:aldehyde dehydrogenase family protein [Actinoplanes pyxinae]MCY1140984.1 aldehyde dehydrogenase family protein [Actinoplanes pyxinae]